jgi:gamma-glutamyltranspeptidase/glutathione hydrolase
MTGVAARPPSPRADHVAATATGGMISTSHPAATQAGVAALAAGGTAVDAYLTAAAVQTVVEPTMSTLAGGLAITVWDAKSRSSQLLAGVGTLPAAEDADLDEAARLSGRTVVPPGWVHGAHAAWERWGRLPWADVLEPALVAAREGVVVDHLLHGWAFEFRGAAGRYAAGREAFFPDGRMFTHGDVLKQPALARTIEGLAAHGPSYFKDGEFARRYVAAAREAGGRITLDDMAAAGPIEMSLPSLPLVTGHELQTNGLLFALMLNAAAVGDLGSRGPAHEDPETLYLLLRIVQECWHFGLDLADGAFRLPTHEELMAAVSDEQAEKIWDQVRTGPPRPFAPMNSGTNAIVAADADGTVAHGTHSASSTPFGVGLVVDGVIVPRPMTLFANPMPPIPIGWATSLLALKDGDPVLAMGSPSMSAVENVFQNTFNVLLRGVDPADSVRQPLFGASYFPKQSPMVESSMGDDVIAEVERRGITLDPVAPWEPEMGSCHAVQLRPDGTLRGVADPRRLGQAAGPDQEESR